MNIPVNLPSENLESQFLKLSQTVKDKNYPDKDKNIKAEIERTLLMLDVEYESLNVSSKEVLDDLREKLILAKSNSKWDEIPPPGEMKMTFDELKLIASAIFESMVDIFSDINDVIKLIIEINKKYANQKMKESLLHMDGMMKAAKVQFDEIMLANQKQLSADKTSAGFQIAASFVSLQVNIACLGGSLINMKNAKADLDKLKDAQELKVKFGTHDETLKSINERKTAIKKDVQSGKITNADADEKLKSLDRLEQFVNDVSTKNKDIDFKKLFDDRSNQIRETSEFLAAFRGVGDSYKGIIESIGGIKSAEEKFAASSANLRGQVNEFFKNMEQNFSQNDMDLYRKVMDTIDKFIQAMSSLMQALDRAMSTIVSV